LYEEDTGILIVMAWLREIGEDVRPKATDPSRVSFAGRFALLTEDVAMSWVKSVVLAVVKVVDAGIMIVVPAVGVMLTA
jgi:hypothetical protein